VLTALGERDGAVQDAEPRAPASGGLLVALIRPVIGHGPAAQLEGQRPARQVREPNASGSQSSSKSTSSCTFMIPSVSPGRNIPVIETPVSPLEIESGRVSAVSLLLKGAQTPTDPQMVPTGHPCMPTGRRAKLLTGVLRRLSAGFGAPPRQFLDPSLDHLVRTRGCVPMPGKLWTSHPRKVINRFHAKDSGPGSVRDPRRVMRAR
jgi:hypothetical protein